MIVAVIGPPCSGKTTYVREHAGPADIVIDFDAMAVAIGSPTEHDHAPALIPLIESMRHSLIRKWLSRSRNSIAWLILTRLDQLSMVPQGCIHRVVTMDTPTEECIRRAIKNGRQQATIDAIRHSFISTNSREW